MELRDIRDESQFPAFYSEKGLTDMPSQIKFLMEEMGILFVRCGGQWTEEERLKNLEQHALESWDRIPATRLPAEADS